MNATPEDAPTATADVGTEEEPVAAAPLARVLEVRLPALAERNADRDREMARQSEEISKQREEIIKLRLEVHEARLETAALKQQLQRHIKHADKVDGELWYLICAVILEVGLVGGLILALRGL
jgi:hypothetical protein